MKFLFGVQTEGNGHITQSIAVKQFLQSKGHEVKTAMAAKKDKKIVNFFSDEFDIVDYNGFDFAFKKGKIIIWRTIVKNIVKLPLLIKSFLKICETIKKEKPDAICNFYEPLVGLSAIFFPKIKYISFGHQYAMTTERYPKTKGFWVQKAFLKIINFITSIRAKKVALSYYNFEDKNLIVCPPILRKQAHEKSNDKENFVLVYIMNEDLVPQFILKTYNHIHKKFHLYTKNSHKIKYYPDHVKIFELDGEDFLNKMKICKAVICSGGFETSSEAVWHNKPLLMIPIPNHYEQHANCRDAFENGLANWSKDFDINLIPKQKPSNNAWFEECEKILTKAFESVSIKP